MKIIIKLLLVFIAIVGVVGALKAYQILKILDPEPIVMWDESAEANTQKINHEKWQSILSKYVYVAEDNIALFDYENVTDDDIDLLQEYLDEMEATNPRDYRRTEAMAYWINVYNAVTIHLVLYDYPVDSIKDIGEGIPGFGPWEDKTFTVSGESLSLNEIEHGILRRVWNDNRIHYAVNCASIGCPNLSGTAYTSANLEQQLQTAAKQFINHPRGVNFENDTLVLSSIFNWFVSDFGGSEESLLKDLQSHAGPKLKQQLQAYDGDIDYQYDWNINAK